MDIREFNDKVALLVTCGTLSRHAPLQSLRQKGVRIVCINPSIQPWAEGIIKDWIVICDLSNHEQAIEAALLYAKQHNIAYDAILCINEGLCLFCIPYVKFSRLSNDEGQQQNDRKH